MKYEVIFYLSLLCLVMMTQWWVYSIRKLYDDIPIQVSAELYRQINEAVVKEMGRQLEEQK